MKKIQIRSSVTPSSNGFVRVRTTVTNGSRCTTRTKVVRVKKK